MLWLALAGVLLQQPALELRFHHLHVSVPDQAAALTLAADRVAGAPVILQGHGPGVRHQGRYLVFDHESASDQTGTPAAAVTRLSADDKYAAASEWVSEHGLSVASESFADLPIQRGLGSGRVTTVAFSSPTPDAVVELLRARGVEPFDNRFENARYRIAADLVLEITPETDKPDTHWCPMHPGVRSAGPAVCAICSMNLVPIPPPRVGEYSLEVTIEPVSNRSGSFRLEIVVRDPDTRDVVRKFLEVHERLFHLFIISRDLERFAHVHPAHHASGTFVLEHALEPGEYMLIADFLPADGTSQTVHRAIVTPGYRGDLFGRSPALKPSAIARTVEGLRVALEAKRVEALRPATLRFEVTDASTGTPIRDLEPYLGAAGHLLIVNPDLTTAIHAHPADTAPAAPELMFDAVLPESGPVKMWLQIQRLGKVLTVPFVIDVARE